MRETLLWGASPVLAATSGSVQPKWMRVTGIADDGLRGRARQDDARDRVGLAPITHICPGDSSTDGFRVQGLGSGIMGCCAE